MSATLEPFLRCLPGLGFCERTRPRCFLFELTLVILPTRQWAFVIALLAAPSLLPFSFGTTH